MIKMNLCGKRFGKLTVLGEADPIHNHRRWVCQCDCGNKVTIYQTCLNSGNTKSCGCLTVESAKRRFTIHGETNKNSRLHRIWNGVLDRCKNPNNPRYLDYGGRGISICDEWLDYVSFKKWAVSNGYSDELSLDRIDTSGGYCPNNCRWATRYEQQNNMRSNTFITFNDETLTLAQWSRKLNIPYSTLVARWSRGWDVKRMLTTPNQKRGEWSTKKVL